MEILHIGSYWQGENDIVKQMLDSLNEMDHEFKVIEFDPFLYSNTSTLITYKNEESFVNFIDESSISKILDNNKDIRIVIFNAGGLCPTQELKSVLISRGIKIVGIGLSDPDDFYRRDITFFQNFSVYFTNSFETYKKLIENDINAHKISFAVNQYYHKDLNIKREYDFVVIGGCRPERLGIIKFLLSSGFKVLVRGKGWRGKLGIKSLGINSVHGKEQVQSYNKATFYISFPMTYAGKFNVKNGLFEAVACGCIPIVQDFNEIHDFFDERNKEIITYKNNFELLDKVMQVINSQSLYELYRKNSKNRLYNSHIWEIQWQFMLGIINSL